MPYGATRGGILTAMLTLAFMILGNQTASAVATITVVNNDGPGEGFNDPTPFTPVGGNPATTLGEARLIAFQHAAFLWGRCLNSSVEIRIDAEMNPLECSATKGILGAAGTRTGAINFIGAPQANTIYPIALANALAGTDLDPAQNDIQATFNSDMDNGVCLGGASWYYGLDGNAGTDFDFVTVVLHELGHGLGCATFVDLASGKRPTDLNLNDSYMLCLEQHGTNPAAWKDMTDAQRAAAAISDPNLHWVCPNVVGAGGTLTAGVGAGGHVRMHGPNPLELGSSVSHFSTALTPDELMEPTYTVPNHDPGLAIELMQDIGWTVQPKNGTDIVFLLDVTGSTGMLLPQWVAQIPTIAAAWKAYDLNARFGLATHVDFPFSPYGLAGEWAYRVESTLSPNVATLTAALAGLNNENGLDQPESQYEAIYQVLTGAGRDLVDPVNYADPGEIPPTSIGQQFPMVIYHFTFPELFHDRDIEPGYPFPGAKPVAGRTATLNELAVRSSANMFIGLTFISGAAKSRVQAGMQLPQDGIFPNSLISDTGPLAEMAALTGGDVYNVGENLENLQAAIDASINLWSESPQGNHPPDCSLAFPSATEIWPPDHRMVDVTILGVTDPDGDPVKITITAIAQDEPVTDTGAGRTEPDGYGVGTGVAQVRAERSGRGNGRVYRISYEATDDAGGSCRGSVYVCVPHDQAVETWDFAGDDLEVRRRAHRQRRPRCEDDGPIYDSTAGSPTILVSQPEESRDPAGNALHVRLYPNPFNPSTTIEYSVPRAQEVSVGIYNVLGQRVRILVNGQQPPGMHRVVWDGQDESGLAVPSGVYLYRVSSLESEEVGRMLLIK